MDFAPVITPAYVAKPLRLEPFRGLLLTSTRVGDPASARAFARPYRDVDARLREWEAAGRVTRDDREALYLHEYTAGGLTVRGLVGALAIDRRAAHLDDRAVWPHEGIHPEQAKELAARMHEMGMNPAPILLVHEGPATVRDLLHATATRTPDVEYLDRADRQQRIWAISDVEEIAAINRALADSSAIIADGHHRYAAYLQLQEEHPGTPWDRGLAMLVDQTDTPLFLGAIHRTVAGVTLADVAQAAGDCAAEVQSLARDEALTGLAPPTLVVTDGEEWLVITPPSTAGLELVQWLQGVLVPALGDHSPVVAFHHTAEEALSRAGTHGGGQSTVAVLLPAPDFRAVRDVVNRGGLLPEKATSFQPKPSLGVLMRSVRDEVTGPR